MCNPGISDSKIYDTTDSDENLKRQKSIKKCKSLVPDKCTYENNNNNN